MSNYATTLNVSMPGSLRHEVERAAKGLCMSNSEFIRSIVRTYLQAQAELTATVEPKQSGSPSQETATPLPLDCGSPSIEYPQGGANLHGAATIEYPQGGSQLQETATASPLKSPPSRSRITATNRHWSR